MEEFIDRISEHNSNCYFHNLGFDGKFILDYLLNAGYQYIVHDSKMMPGTFKSLISGMGKFYSITVMWENGHTTEFRDSWKKLPMTVRRVAQSFQLEEGKGDIDYTKPRPIGYKPTPEEWDYLRRDVSIVAQAMHVVLESGMTRLTVASDAMNEYKNLMSAKMFDRMFPVLGDVIDTEIRRAYRGGFTYCAKRYQGKKHGKGLVLDVNSLYPYVMRSRILPYGEPQFKRGKVLPTEDYPCTIFSVTFTATLKPNHVPCIQIKGSMSFAPVDYLEVIDEPTTMMVTNTDWALYTDHYDIDVLAYGGGWRFKAAPGLFNDYIDKWSKVKAESKGGKREVAKLHLNSLYGKFASNPNVTGKYPVLRDGIVKLEMGPDERRDPVYTAVGAFITSYARDLTIRAAQANYDRFLYADTDSLHLLGTELPEGLEVHPTKLGAWKLEYTFEEAFYVRPKAYMEYLHPTGGCSECAECEQCQEAVVWKLCIRHLEGHFVTRIAGLPETVTEQLTFEDLYDGNVLHGKLTPKTVPGGVILQDTTFTLKM